MVAIGRDTGTEATGPRFLRDAFNIATEDPTTAELPKQAEHEGATQ